MTKSIFHPSRELLLDWALGELPSGPTLTLRLHIETCAGCRAVVGAHEEVEGRRMAEAPALALRPDALASVVRRIGEAETGTAQADKTPGNIQLPAALTDITFAERRHIGPETWVAHVVTPNPGKWLTYLLRAPAGTRFPNHGHDGPEYISLIDGAYTDTRDHITGDFAENLPGFEHVMKISQAGSCLCLISTLGPIPLPPEHRDLNRVLGV